MSEFQQVVKEGAETVGRKIKRLFLMLLGIALILGLLFVWVAGWTFSDGTRAGELIKVSKKGVVLKPTKAKSTWVVFRQITVPA